MDKQIILKSIENDNDLETMFKWINNKEFVNFNAPYTPIHYVNHLEWFNNIRKKDSISLFSIRFKKNNELIGTCQLHNINSINRTAELQIRIDLQFTGNGYGQMALNLLLLYGFNDLNLNKIYLHVFEDNLRAISLYKKLGFQEEGLLKKHVYINGKYKNVLIMSKFRQEI